MLNTAIVILNYNTKDLSKNCIESIVSKKWKNHFSVYFVDNGSSDGSAEFIKSKYKEVKIISNTSNLGYTGGYNSAIKKIYKNFDYLLLLNSDTLVTEGSLDSLAGFARNRDLGISSCRLENVSEELQPNAGSLPYPPAAFFWISGLDDIFKKIIHLPTFHETNMKFYNDEKIVGWVSGAAMLIRRDVFKKIGFFDENIFMYAEDVDYCWRAVKAGFKVGWTGNARIIHLEGASSKANRKANQWLGEFKGIVYLYSKYFGKTQSFIARIVIKKFVLIRIIAFYLASKREYANTYAKIFNQI